MKKLFFLLMTVVCALLYAPPASAWTVYLDPANIGTSATPTAYVWGANKTELNGSWPGKQMTQDKYGRWIASGTGTPTNVIFTYDGSNKCFSGDPTYSDNYTYTWDGTNETETITKSEWKEYTVYFDKTNRNWTPYIFTWGKTTPTGFTQMTLASGNIYSVSLASGETTPTLIFNNGSSFNNNDKSNQTVDVSITNNYVYKTTSKVTSGNDANKWNVSGEEYNPVSITSVELLKDGVSAGVDNAAPYQFSLSGLKGTEKFLIKVSYDNSTSKTYTVSSGTSLREGSTQFALDSKIISTQMTVNVSGTAATSYSINATVYDAITSVTLDGASPIVKTSAPYTFSGVVLTDSGYTVIVKTKRDTEGTSYTFSNSAATVGNYTLTQGETPFHVASSLAKFNATVTVDGSTFKATGITISDPSAVISEVKLVRRDNGQTLTLTSTDGGATWTYTGTAIKTFNDGTATNDRSYQLVVTNNGTDQKWYYDSDNYKFETGKTYSTANSWKTTTGTQRFRFGGNDGKNYKVTVKLSADKKSIASLRFEEYVAPAANLHMPLKEEDFANGPRYFLVGSRTADWCLQPEWELHVSGNQATLSGRFMQMQIFGIAKVDSYDDYIFQRYTLYANDGTEIYNSNKTNIQLKDMGASHAIRYENQSESETLHTTNNSLKWMVGVEDWKDKWTAHAWEQAPHSYINKLTLTLNADGTPNTLSFDSTTDKSTLSNHRVLTLVGSAIKYDGNYDFDGTGTGTKPLDELGRFWKNGDRSKITGWSNSWVQFDPETNQPYIDGYGNTVYNTAFDKEWLENHYTWFFNKDKNLVYKSTDVTFFPADMVNDEYADVYKMHPGIKKQIGNQSITSGKFSYTEKFTNYKTNHNTDVSDDNWKCYVVKDMWMSGNFKVWTGSGQGIKYYNTVNDIPAGESGGINHGAEKAIQWFYENGGHGDEKQKKPVKGSDLTIPGVTADMYPTKRDIEDADFRIEKMTYYSRVIFWYNPTEGFDGSVLQLVEAAVGPNIQAYYNVPGKKNTLKYQWWIKVADSTDSSHDDDEVTNYTITRYTYDSNGKEMVDAIVENNKSLPTGTKVKDLKWDGEGTIPFTDTYKAITAFTDDSHSLAPGTYFYRITVKIKNVDKKAKSNELPIHITRIPVTMDVKQQKYDESGNLNDNGGIYSFNVEYNAAPVKDYLDDKVGNTENTVADAMQYYVITVDDATAARLNSAAQKPFEFKQVASESIYLSDASKLKQGTWYHRAEITDKSNPDIKYVWENVAPTAADADGTALKGWNNDKTAIVELADNYTANYAFTTYLVSADGFIESWASLNFDAKSDHTPVIAPAPKLSVSSVSLRKATERTLAKKSHDPMATETHTDHLSGTRLLALDDDAKEYKFENRIVYKRLNEVAADAGISALDVTDEVATNNSVTYDIYVTKAGNELSSTLGEASAHASLAGGNKAIEMTIYDLPLNEITKVEAIDGTHKEILDGGASTYDSHLMVTYSVGGKLFVNDTDNADRDIQFNPGIDTFDPSAGTKALSKYKGEYWHNGKNPTNPNVKPCECDDPNCEPHKEHLGYFAHGVVDFTLNGIDNESKNAYVSFHAQQPYFTHSEHNNGCYKEDNGWYKHSFAGTRAANGGKPVANWNNDLTADGRYLDGYEEYTEGEWKDVNDWSTIAVVKQHLPLHINPIYQFNSETDYNKGKIEDNSTVLTAKFSAIYPVVNPGKMSVEVKASASSAARRADAAPSRDFDSVHLIGVSKSVDVNLNGTQTTGVDDIITDIPGDAADAEYYNLQGIRIAHPAKGQIYIVRQGDRVSKVLY